MERMEVMCSFEPCFQLIEDSLMEEFPAVPADTSFKTEFRRNAAVRKGLQESGEHATDGSETSTSRTFCDFFICHGHSDRADPCWSVRGATLRVAVTRRIKGTSMSGIRV